MINDVSFTSNKTMAQQYLERKAAQIEANVAETIKESGRVIINKNKAAARSGGYIPEDAYFGKVPVVPRKIGQAKTMESVAVTKTNIAPVKGAKVQAEIVPENSINYIA